MLVSVRRSRILLGALLLTAAAHAEPLDPAAAEELFVEGRAAMDRGDFTTACRRFEESERLDPAAGTLINWAECLNREGKPASSRLKWREALDALSPNDERRTAAAERIAALESSVPRLEIRMDPAAPLSSMVKRDGIAVDPVTFGLAIPVDPGAHRIDVTAPGRVGSEFVATLAEGEHRVIVVGPGPPLVVAAPLAPAPVVPKHGPPVAAWVVGAVGAASLVTGATFGVLAIVAKDRMDDGCPRSSGTRVCTDSGFRAAQDGQTYATIANIMVPIGVAGLGFGGYLLWSGASSDARTGPNHAAELHVASAF